jgi:hypothetical protein
VHEYSFQKYTKDAELSWKSTFASEYGYIIGTGEGMFSNYVSRSPNGRTSSTTLYHVNVYGAEDLAEPGPGFYTLLATGGASNDTYMTNFEELKSGGFQKVVERYVYGPSLSSITASSITRPNQTATVTLTSNVAAPAGGLKVTLSSNDPAVVFSSPIVIIPAGNKGLTTSVHVGTLTTDPAKITATGANGVLRDAFIGY